MSLSASWGTMTVSLASTPRSNQSRSPWVSEAMWVIAPWMGSPSGTTKMRPSAVSRCPDSSGAARSAGSAGSATQR